MSDQAMPTLGFDTLAVRAGTKRSEFKEHSEALFLTSSFVFDSAEQAAARFSGAEPGCIYSRFSNPTVNMLQERLAALEGAEACIATASGMAAILSTCMALLQSGDHIVASQSIFGSTQQLFGNILTKFGITTEFVTSTEPAAFAAAMTANTKLIFIETPSNPLMAVYDIAALAEVAHQHAALLVVDNCFCTPVLQQPLTLGADLVIHSATKYLDGQGRVLGGAVCGSHALTEKVYVFLRTTGATLSAFNAWVILKGLETLSLRMQAQSASAMQLAQWLEVQPQVSRVYYPGLKSHPHHALASRQQQGPGAILSFDVRGERSAAWRVIDHCKLLSITANLGDTKTTITHPASTTHGRISPEARAASGIGEGLLRIAVGLENLADLKADLAQALAMSQA